MSAHSPADWTWHRLVDEAGEPVRGEALKRYIAECVDAGVADADFYFVSCPHPDGGSADVCHTGNGPTSATNARLIAAAPDLLAALRDAVQTLTHAPSCGAMFLPPPEPARACDCGVFARCRRYEAAIAKAEACS